MPVLKRLNDEPDDAFAALRRYYEQRTHLETDSKTLEKVFGVAAHVDWAETYDWDLRCDVLDAELDRRRNIGNAHLKQTIAANLLSVMSAKLILADVDNKDTVMDGTDPEMVVALASLLDSVVGLVAASSATLEANRLTQRSATKPRPAKRTTPRKTKAKADSVVDETPVVDNTVPDPDPKPEPEPEPEPTTNPEPAAKVAEPVDPPHNPDTPRPTVPVLINPLN